MSRSKDELLLMEGRGGGDIGVCGIALRYLTNLRYFDNYNLEMWYCGVLRACRMCFVAFRAVLEIILQRFPSLFLFPIGVFQWHGKTAIPCVAI